MSIAKPYLIAKKASHGIYLSPMARRFKDVKDILGLKFGSLLVTERIFTPGKRGVNWKCKCVCGNECVAYGGHLRAGNRASCGCKHEVNVEKTGCKILYRITQRKCNTKKREFSLTLEEFSRLIKMNCHYCKIEPFQEIKRAKSKKTQIVYNGIDRIDSSKGYFLENCVPCCKWCNQSKSSRTFEEWKKHVLRLAECL